jgi:poly(3-hydroxybutyrate) depolymerase
MQQPDSFPRSSCRRRAPPTQPAWASRQAASARCRARLEMQVSKRRSDEPHARCDRARRSAVVRAGALLLAGIAAASLPTSARAADPLPSFHVDLAQSSVSGLSSGAYMAGQFHVAFSQTLVGAAIIAGGPYDCAEGQLGVALNRCMQTTAGGPDAAHLLARAETLAREGRIDPLSGLDGDRVYVFSGTRDDTVTPAVVDQTVAFYRQAGVPEARIEYVHDLAAGHAFLTEDRGNACGSTETPFINDCDYDQAGALLGQIYGPLNPPATAPGGRLIEFDQTEFLPQPIDHGMAATGFAYVPASCAGGEPCRVHVAFHGCKQTVDLIGHAFLTESGYNRWADSNHLIILYPQAHATALNPNACWDWWGYDDPDYAIRSGRQMAAVRAMLTRLAGASQPPPRVCRAYRDSNLDHWWAGRAEVCAYWFLCAVGSGDNLGFAAGASTLYESPAGYFSAEPCAP